MFGVNCLCFDFFSFKFVNSGFFNFIYVFYLMVYMIFLVVVLLLQFVILLVKDLLGMFDVVLVRIEREGNGFDMVVCKFCMVVYLW